MKSTVLWVVCILLIDFCLSTTDSSENIETTKLPDFEKTQKNLDLDYLETSTITETIETEDDTPSVISAVDPTTISKKEPDSVIYDSQIESIPASNPFPNRETDLSFNIPYTTGKAKDGHTVLKKKNRFYEKYDGSGKALFGQFKLFFA